MSNISFVRSVFKRLVLQTCKTQGLFGKVLIENFSEYFWSMVLYQVKLWEKGSNKVLLLKLTLYFEKLHLHNDSLTCC